MLQIDQSYYLRRKKNVADFVYDVNAIDHCLSYRIKLLQVR